MFCPHCGTQQPEPASLCSNCSRPLPSTPSTTLFASATGEAAAAAPAGLPSHTAPASPPRKTMHVVGGLAIAVVVLFAALFAFGVPVPTLPDETKTAGFRLGRLFGVLLIPLLIAYPIAGRKKARSPNLFAGLFCGIALFLILGNVAASLGTLPFENSHQMVGRLAREAAGLQPVRKSMFGEGKTEAKLRELFKQVVALNKDYQAEVDHLDMSAVANLNTPQSFADPETAALGLRQLHSAYDLDVHQEQRMSKIMENFRRGADDLPASERESFLQGFNTGMAKVTPLRGQAITTEKAWVHAVDEVYAYAHSHHAQIHLIGGRLQVTDHAALVEFNRRIGIVNQTRQEFLKAKGDLERSQAEFLKGAGLRRGDTGLH